MVSHNCNSYHVHYGKSLINKDNLEVKGVLCLIRHNMLNSICSVYSNVRVVPATVRQDDQLSSHPPPRLIEGGDVRQRMQASPQVLVVGLVKTHKMLWFKKKNSFPAARGRGEFLPSAF